jgi:hypothetical protein
VASEQIETFTMLATYMCKLQNYKGDKLVGVKQSRQQAVVAYFTQPDGLPTKSPVD